MYSRAKGYPRFLQVANFNLDVASVFDWDDDANQGKVR